MRLARVFTSVAFGVILSSGSVTASTSCRQFFDVIGLTADSVSTLCFYEHGTSECEGFIIHELQLTEDSLLEHSDRWAYRLTASVWTECQGEADSFEEMWTLSKRADGYIPLNPNYGMRGQWMRPPPFDADFTGMPPRGVDVKCPNTEYWRRVTPGCEDSDTCFFDEPEFNFPAKLLWYLPSGLYKNYTIEQAYFFPISDLVILVVHQPRKCAGNDTMFGVLVYKVLDR